MMRIAHCAITGEKAEEVGALLVAAGFEGLEETTHELKAYASEETYLQLQLEAVVQQLAAAYEFSYHTESLPDINWNEAWESAFQPVEVAGQVIIRASFHTPRPDLPHDIVIDPKMSFGTGHHATTWQMISRMLQLDFQQKRVLDFGSGTAVLAILAARLGATMVDAIDNDTWAFDNAKENMIANDCTLINPLLGTLTDLMDTPPYDIILANINRHVLLENATLLRKKLAVGGILLVSGILEEDEQVLSRAFEDAGIQITYATQRDRWLCWECK